MFDCVDVFGGCGVVDCLLSGGLGDVWDFWFDLITCLIMCRCFGCAAFGLFWCLFLGWGLRGVFVVGGFDS